MKRTKFSDLAIEDMVAGIQSGDRVMLGRAITLVESKHLSHQTKGTALLTNLLKQDSSAIRIAISGAPGVGKSTFIESLGMHIVNQGHKVAVLTIDPSSDIHKGSILGDKTRMEQLSVHPDAFIRPSPAGDFLGGIAWRTREAMTICEAAGFDVIIIETVGVGQSEFKVRDMVDCFFLLVTPGGGDELQGIKKGIVEIADIIAINKCDGDLKTTAKQTQKAYQQAIHLYPSKTSGWSPKVITTSGEYNMGIDESWELINSYIAHIQDNHHIDRLRDHQNLVWFHERIAASVYQFIDDKTTSGALTHLKEALKERRMNALEAADQAITAILKR